MCRRTVADPIADTVTHAFSNSVSHVGANIFADTSADAFSAHHLKLRGDSLGLSYEIRGPRAAVRGSVRSQCRPPSSALLQRGWDTS